MHKLSIGLPVYNGERYIEFSLKSILNQTFTDFELIICDNASNDNTGSICREYCRLDRRIKYFHNTANIGAAANYNKVFKLSKGEFFKWCSHDDLLASMFFEKCLDVLEKDKSTVLAYPETEFIDEYNRPLKQYSNNLKTDSCNPVKRFKSLLPYGTMCNPIFGIFRAKVLKKTRLIGSYQRADNVLLARISLEGRFKKIDEYLFYRRLHPEQSLTLINNLRNWAIWFDPKNKDKIITPHLTVLKEYVKSVNESNLLLPKKLECFIELTKWTYRYKPLLFSDLRYYLLNVR